MNTYVQHSHALSLEAVRSGARFAKPVHAQPRGRSVAVAAVPNALQNKELSPFYYLPRRVALVDVAPPYNGVIVGVRHAHYPLRKG